MTAEAQNAEIRSPGLPTRWVSWWLTLLPPFYILAPLGVLGLPGLRLFSRPVLLVLAIYALSQQIPAAFTPEPLLASVLALLRTVLLFGLIGLGALLSDSRHLRFLIPGLFAVYITAFGFTAFSQTDLSTSRLSHPYMTSISLGLTGAFGIWLALLLPGRLFWRLSLGISSLAVVMLSGSRGPLIAAFIGCFIGSVFLIKRRTIIISIAFSVLTAILLFLGSSFGYNAIERLGNSDTTGRDIIWANTLSVVKAFPLTGVGSYRLGSHITPPGKNCELFNSTDGRSGQCPEWLEKLGNPWLIAHSLILHQLAETGFIGLFGTLLLLGVIFYSTAQRRDSIGMAVIFGSFIINITDNTLLVPSLFFAELFWITAGMSLLNHSPRTFKTSRYAYSLLVLIICIVILKTYQPPDTKGFAFNIFSAPQISSNPKGYTSFFQISGPDGIYRLHLESCTTSCVSLNTQYIEIDKGISTIVSISTEIRPSKSQILVLKILNRYSGFSISPLAVKSWQVVTR